MMKLLRLFSPARLLRNFSIARKLVIAFALLVLVAAGAIGVNYHNLTQIEHANDLATRSNEVLRTMNLTLTSIVDQETGIRGYLIAEDKAFLQAYTVGAEDYDRAIVLAKNMSKENPERLEKLEQLDKLAQSWRRNVAEREIELTQAAGGFEMARLMVASGEGRRFMDGIRKVADEITTMERNRLRERAKAQDAVFDLSYLLSMASLGVLLFIAASAAILLQMSIAKPIRRMTDTMKALAEGNHQVDVPGMGRKDEVGAMAAAVEVFKQSAIENERLTSRQAEMKVEAEREKREAMARLADSFESSVGQALAVLSQSAAEMHQTAGSMASTAEQTSQQSMMVSSGAEEASANVQAVASAAEELVASIGEVGRQVAASAEKARLAGGVIARTDGTMRELADAAQQIGNVVGLISDVAAQTNLLALNATIEAARAGEAGRGFAVVASEVKTLASQTTKATDEISQNISAIQAATNAAVSAMAEIAAAIAEMEMMASTVTTAAEQQTAATSEITRNVTEAASGTRDVSQNIAGVSSGAQHTGAAASQVLAAAGELGKQAETLSRDVSEFLNEVRAA